MSKPDHWVIIILAGLILSHLSVWVIGFITHTAFYLITGLNLFSGLGILIYWFRKQLRIKQHIIERREITGLIFEVVVAGCAVYSIVTNHWNNWWRVPQYIFFAIHLSCMLLFLVFVLTFKMKKLI